MSTWEAKIWRFSGDSKSTRVHEPPCFAVCQNRHDSNLQRHVTHISVLTFDLHVIISFQKFICVAVCVLFVTFGAYRSLWCRMSRWSRSSSSGSVGFVHLVLSACLFACWLKHARSLTLVAWLMTHDAELLIYDLCSTVTPLLWDSSPFFFHFRSTTVVFFVHTLVYSNTDPLKCFLSGCWRLFSSDLLSLHCAVHWLSSGSSLPSIDCLFVFVCTFTTISSDVTGID